MTAVSAAKTVRCNPSMPARAPARTRASESALANALTCAQSLWSQPAAHCSLSVASQVATGSDLQGGGVFSFIKAKGTPQNRAIIGSVFIALGVFFTNPELVTVSTASYVPGVPF